MAQKKPPWIYHNTDGMAMHLKQKCILNSHAHTLNNNDKETRRLNKDFQFEQHRPFAHLCDLVVAVKVKSELDSTYMSMTNKM